MEISSSSFASRVVRLQRTFGAPVVAPPQPTEEFSASTMVPASGESIDVPAEVTSKRPTGWLLRCLHELQLHSITQGQIDSTRLCALCFQCQRRQLCYRSHTHTPIQNRRSSSGCESTARLLSCLSLYSAVIKHVPKGSSFAPSTSIQRLFRRGDAIATINRYTIDLFCQTRRQISY